MPEVLQEPILWTNEIVIDQRLPHGCKDSSTGRRVIIGFDQKENLPFQTCTRDQFTEADDEDQKSFIRTKMDSTGLG